MDLDDHALLLMGPRGTNSGPHDCSVRALTTEQPPCSPTKVINCN